MLLYLCFAPFVLEAAISFVYRTGWPKDLPSEPWHANALGALGDAVVAAPIVVVMALFFARLRIVSDEVLAYPNETFAGLLGTLLVASVVLMPVLVCWLRRYGPFIAPRRWKMAFALLAAAVVLHLVFVERGSGDYSLSEPPQGAWFAGIGEVHGEEAIAPMMWFAPRFGGDEYWSAACFVLGILMPVVAVAGALVSLLTGRQLAASAGGDSGKTDSADLEHWLLSQEIQEGHPSLLSRKDRS